MLRLMWCLDHAVLSLLIQNFAMMNGHCEQTNHRYSIFCPVANLHSSICTIIGSAPSGRCHPVMSRVNSIYWSRPTTTFSICIPNPFRSGPLRPEPVRSKPTGTSPSGSCSANIRFSCTRVYCYIRITKAVYKTGRTFLTKIITKLY